MKSITYQSSRNHILNWGFFQTNYGVADTGISTLDLGPLPVAAERETVQPLKCAEAHIRCSITRVRSPAHAQSCFLPPGIATVVSSVGFFR